MELRCYREPWSDAIKIAAFEEAQKGHMMCAERLTMRPVTEGELVEPIIRLGHSEAQRLMDELWGCGLRPSEGSGSAGSLAATERHLKDMQTIAMGLLRKDGLQA